MLNPLPIRKLKRTILIPAPIERVFDFFSLADNLNLIIPPWLKFQILTPGPIRMELNTVIDFALKIYGIPVQWRSEITEWHPPGSFTDKQIKGPYAIWEHKHSFFAKDNGTIMEDTVIYSVPGFIFEPVVNVLMVGWRLKKIFDFREEKILELFK